MGFFDKIFGKNSNKSSQQTSHLQPLIEDTNDPEAPPLWRSIPSEENREKDLLKGINYNSVRIVFENGEIVNVIPDVNNYYKASIYNINNQDFDITKIEDVNNIPLPKHKFSSTNSLGTPVYRLEYLLRLRAGTERDKGNIGLAYALMNKGTEMLKYSSLEWQRHDYLREYYWLLDDDRIEEAEQFFKRIAPDLPAPFSEKEHIREVQHYNYAVLKKHFPNELPKSFSAYMRNYNKQDSKYDRFIDLGKQLNIDITKN